MLTIRPATPLDVPALFVLIRALAEYEKLSHLVTGSTEALEEHLFGDRPYAEALVADWETNTVGFALFFFNYSTFLTKPGIYLEDLFVLPEYRRRGIAKVMLSYLAQLAVDRGAGRLEWSVLDWNDPAIDFYKSIGASIMEEWRICRIAGDSISRLADGA
jgi:GNAT superfamily N-acetyltransferase